MAQGFLQSLFGGGANEPPPRPLQAPLYGYRAPLFNPHQNRDRERERERDRGDTGEAKSSRFRTLCVRLCDGYYWPVSNAAPRTQFYRDANLCRSSCGEDARLFFHPSSSADTNEMVDLQGRAYARLATAYIYRKRQVDGCKCKPDPWSRSELERHASYAVQEKDASERVARATAPAQPSTVSAPQTTALAGSAAAGLEPDAPLAEDARPPAADPAVADGVDQPAQRSVRDKAERRERSATLRPSAERSAKATAKPQRSPADAVAAKPAKWPAAPFGLGAGSGARWPGD